MVERRRSPRHDVDGELAIVPAGLHVRVLDISVAGVLLQSSHPLEPGSRGRLRLDLAGSPFVAEVHVQRVVAAPDSKTEYRIGATFVALPSEFRHLIERFMTQ
jgi:hypothetical protein